jgi:hypothetical protein
MKRILIIGVVLTTCGLMTVSCGTDAPFDAKITGPQDANMGPLNTNQFYETVPAAMLFTLTNSDGSTPLPGVTIRFDAGAALAGSFALICAKEWDTSTVPPTCSAPGPPSATFPYGGAESIKMDTSDTGAARVYPIIFTTDCSGTSGSLTGTVTLSASISSAFTTTQIKYQVNC